MLIKENAIVRLREFDELEVLIREPIPKYISRMQV
jgi:hypothetical protein